MCLAGTLLVFAVVGILESWQLNILQLMCFNLLCFKKILDTTEVQWEIVNFVGLIITSRVIV